MAAPALGIKRTCTSCAARFYDLGKSPAECPKCEEKFYPEILLPSREPRVSEARRNGRPQPVAVQEVVKTPETAVLPEGNEDKVDDDDDEVAAIADIGLDDEDDDDDAKADDTTLLESDTDDDDDVSGLVGAVPVEEKNV